MAHLFEDIGCPDNCEGCDGMICDVIERAFRNYAYGDTPLRPMTADERAWCVASADHAGEGSVRVEELTQLDDRELARATIQAWSAYCREMF